MKLRTDFVTNSSSSSFIAFSIEHPELYELLLSFGIKILETDENCFSNGMTVELPSGEEFILYSEEPTWFPSFYDSNSTTAWIISLLLWEIEDVYPQKEFEEYSDYTIELVKLLNEKGIIKLDIDDTTTWDRETLLAQLENLKTMDKKIKNATMEFNDGFEGEVLGLEYKEQNGDYSLTIAWHDSIDEEVENPEGLNIFISGDKESEDNNLVEFILSLGCNCASKITDETDYVISTQQDFTVEENQKISDWCIPVISEQGFRARFTKDYSCIEDDIYEEMYECTYSGGFYDLFYDYGIGKVIRRTTSEK